MPYMQVSIGHICVSDPCWCMCVCVCAMSCRCACVTTDSPLQYIDRSEKPCHVACRVILSAVTGGEV